MSDPYEAGGLSVTIKGDEPGGKFNDPKSPAPWIVFHGSAERIKEQLIETFDLDEQSVERPLYELVVECNTLFKSVANVADMLGGKVLNPAQADAPQASSGGSSVFQQAAQGGAPSAPAEPAKDPILTALELCQTVAEVQQVWAENQAKFNSNETYMSAYKARGKALSTAS